MENTNDKFVTGSFLLAGVLVGIVLHALVRTISGMVPGAVGNALSSDMMVHIMPVLIGAIAFAIMQFTPSIRIWGDEVVSEIRKISWPSQRDTMAMTVVVCVMLVLAGLIIGGFDVISAYTIDALLNFNFSA